MTCFICQRQPIHGLAYKGRPLCSACAPHCLQGEMMIDISDAEEEALTAGGVAAGAYLDEIGKTDLANLSGDEWRSFLCKVLGGYSEHMQAEAKKYPPF